MAWLFNIRGADVSHTPLPLGFAYLPLDGRPIVFRRRAQADGGEPRKVSADTPTSSEPDALAAFVEDLGRQGLRVAFDAATAPARLTQALEARAARPTSAPIRSR